MTIRIGGYFACMLIAAILQASAAAAQPDDTESAAAINEMATAYLRQERYDEAEKILQRAPAIYEKTPGSDKTSLANSLAMLANLYRRNDTPSRLMRAASLYQDALAIYQRARNAGQEVARTLNNLGLAYHELGRYDDGAMLFERAISMQRDEVARARIRQNLARTYSTQGRLAEARELYETALRVLQANSDAQTDLAFHYLLGANPFMLWSSFDNLRDNAYERLKAADAGLSFAQLTQSRASAALAQMTARFGAGSTAVAKLVRERQDLTVLWQVLDKGLLTAVLASPNKRNQVADSTAARQRRKGLEDRIAAVSVRIESEFPDYVALAAPKPLPLNEAQNLVGLDEAMLVFQLDDDQSYVWVITREAFDWQPLDIGAKDLADKVAAVRRGLDLEAVSKSIEAGKPVLFDLKAAHDLYSTLLGPVKALIDQKRQLLIVPTGALTALPFHLLVTEETSTARLDAKDFSKYREAAWLAKTHSVAVLPSVGSLKALRVFAGQGNGSKPMIGFGDPVFRDEALPPGGKRVALAKTAKTRAYADYWRGAEIDRVQLADALPPLPDTADELKAVAGKLGAPPSDIFLGRDASVTNVKHAVLSDYRIVYFATHGLVAGDVKGLGEPALVLALPKQPSEFDSGLLTASEVAQLKLNADWVVLSACNTMAGDSPGAEALSGLARAFFYAGARSLLVSHWVVDSNAAVQLTTRTFDTLTATPNVGRAEALRRAMLSYMNDLSEPRNAYPAFWAPFSIVGEGDSR